jgi:hypothetical protein
MEPDIGAGAAAERLQLGDRGVDDVVVDVELGLPVPGPYM